MIINEQIEDQAKIKWLWEEDVKYTTITIEQLSMVADLIIEECLDSVYKEVQIIATHKEAAYICDKIKTKFKVNQ